MVEIPNSARPPTRLIDMMIDDDGGPVQLGLTSGPKLARCHDHVERIRHGDRRNVGRKVGHRRRKQWPATVDNGRPLFAQSRSVPAISSSTSSTSSFLLLPLISLLGSLFCSTSAESFSYFRPLALYVLYFLLFGRRNMVQCARAQAPSPQNIDHLLRLFSASN